MGVPVYLNIESTYNNELGKKVSTVRDCITQRTLIPPTLTCILLPRKVGIPLNNERSKVFHCECTLQFNKANGAPPFI